MKYFAVPILSAALFAALPAAQAQSSANPYAQAGHPIWGIVGEVVRAVVDRTIPGSQSPRPVPTMPNVSGPAAHPNYPVAYPSAGYPPVAYPSAGYPDRPAGAPGHSAALPSSAGIPAMNKINGSMPRTTAPAVLPVRRPAASQLNRSPNAAASNPSTAGRDPGMAG